ncbi:DUF2199 domain-containing protein [Zavarzinia sp.]|uniref:DUF2199 domain-containing protein n=1 Tax=Zavarzinia sp. TaxID=2027920 RepID=UPI003564BD75
MAWTCACCGRSFEGLPLDYGTSAPSDWFALPEAVREARARLSEDLCMIDRKSFYVRGCLEIPIAGSGACLTWGIWVAVGAADFGHVLDHWNDPIPAGDPPLDGELASWLDGYPKPEHVACQLVLRDGNLRPLILLAPGDYPLALEQHQGIDWHRVEEIATAARAVRSGAA